MERSVTSQIVDTLHLMLRIILGAGMMYMAVLSGGLYTAYILLRGFSSSSKYGSVHEEVIFIPLIILIVGTFPLAIAACILIFKNKLHSRNPLETAFAILSILSIILFQRLIFEIENTVVNPPEVFTIASIALLYISSSVAVIAAARKDRRSTSVKPVPRLVK